MLPPALAGGKGYCSVFSNTLLHQVSPLLYDLQAKNLHVTGNYERTPVSCAKPGTAVSL